jgi:proteasome lid subunit RPN8/RPN11
MTSKNHLRPRPRRRCGQAQLLFAPLAWLKLQFFCHLGETEIGGFGITAKDDPLYVEDFVTVRQQTSMMTVVMEDEAIADFSDRCVDQGLLPQNYLRIWCHTHPGISADPSGVDEETFARVFGSCDWAVMFILGRTAKTYARLSFHVGPGTSVQLAVNVDWSGWPVTLADPQFSMAQQLTDWQMEFAANIHHRQESFLPVLKVSDDSTAKGSPWEPFAQSWEWTDLDQELLEDFERHERFLNADPQP